MSVESHGDAPPCPSRFVTFRFAPLALFSRLRPHHVSRHGKARPLQSSAWLPYALVAPQILVTAVFFFWPAGETIWQSMLVQDARRQHAVRVVREFHDLFRNEDYSTPSGSRRVLGRGDRDRTDRLAHPGGVRRPRDARAAAIYKTPSSGRMSWPGGRGVLWLFLFSPTLGSVGTGSREDGIAWNPLNGNDAMILIIVAAWEADLAQLPVLPRRPAVDPQVAHRGRRDRRRGTGAALRDDRVPACRPRRSSCSSSTSSTRSSRPSRSSTPVTGGGPARADRDPRVQGLQRRLEGGLDLGGSAAQSAVLMAILVTLTSSSSASSSEGAVPMAQPRHDREPPWLTWCRTSS